MGVTQVRRFIHVTLQILFTVWLLFFGPSDIEFMCSMTLSKVVYRNTYIFYCCQLRVYLPVNVMPFDGLHVVILYTLWNLIAWMVGATPPSSESLASLWLFDSSCLAYLCICLRLWPFLSMSIFYTMLTLSLYSLSHILRNTVVKIAAKFWVKDDFRGEVMKTENNFNCLSHKG